MLSHSKTSRSVLSRLQSSAQWTHRCYQGLLWRQVEPFLVALEWHWASTSAKDEVSHRSWSVNAPQQHLYLHRSIWSGQSNHLRAIWPSLIGTGKGIVKWPWLLVWRLCRSWLRVVCTVALNDCLEMYPWELHRWHPWVQHSSDQSWLILAGWCEASSRQVWDWLNQQLL